MSFSTQTKSWSEKALQKIELAHRKIALDAFSRVILRSPVDTGRFRGNWQVSIGSIPDDVIELEDKAGTVVISKVTAKVLELEAGDTIYLINNLPYARRLEYGWSAQAPGGMVRITAAEFQPIVKKVIEQIRRGS